MKISVKTLNEHGACFAAVERFVKLFGRKGGTVTKARCLKAAQHLDFDWAATHLLSGAAEAMYNRARRKALRKFQTAFRRVTKRVDDAYAVFERKGESEYAKFEAVRDAAVDERVMVRTEFNKARALAFWKAASSKYQG